MTQRWVTAKTKSTITIEKYWQRHSFLLLNTTINRFWKINQIRDIHVVLLPLEGLIDTQVMYIFSSLLHNIIVLWILTFTCSFCLTPSRTSTTENMSKAWITDILDNTSHTSWKRSKTYRPTEKLHCNCMGQLVYPQPSFTWVERKNEAKLEFLRWGSANPKNPSCGKTGYFLEERITTTRMAAD